MSMREVHEHIAAAKGHLGDVPSDTEVIEHTAFVARAIVRQAHDMFIDVRAVRDAIPDHMATAQAAITHGDEAATAIQRVAIGIGGQPHELLVEAGRAADMITLEGNIQADTYNSIEEKMARAFGQLSAFNILMGEVLSEIQNGALQNSKRQAEYGAQSREALNTYEGRLWHL